MAAFFNRPVATPLQRIVCYGCDGLILTNAWLISLIAYGPESTPAAIVGSFLAYYFVYYMGFMVGFGATPAKLVLRTRIVRNLGERPEPAVLLLRYVVFLLTLGVPFGAFVSLWFLIRDPDRRAIHDRIAGTIVVQSS